MLNAIEMILICLVAQAALTDLALRKIPNVLILSGLLLALILHLLSGQPGAPLSQWLAGGCAGFFLFLPLYLLRGMAAGDVKLMAMVGAFVGPWQAVQIAALSAQLGGAMALWMWWRYSSKVSVGIPYGVAIALGTVGVVAWRHH
ncbi:prepilin peptidase [Pseudoduganella sp. FT55W]|uniref:Prepilin peptidase n=1 Tax=Duganella rivi TaxID=2666083 RepID=A0A7X4GUC7_9BURK|nr:prepilin peptidase [Duganella rivi]MYM69271.1 prepilin peptidase [Duganella rivi]